MSTKTEQVLYKVLNRDGRSFHGGDMAYSLPTRNESGEWTPGDWHEVKGALEMCSNGLHLTSDPAEWWDDGARCFVAEHEGAFTADGCNKVAVQRCRLVREVAGEELHPLRIFTTGEHTVSEGTVGASGSATVRASGSATVRASGSATVRASGSATVGAYGSATVEAYGSATVRASGSATVRAYGSATVEASGSATVEAYGSATVRAYGSATVGAYGSATVRASGSATVRASGSATVRASGSATVRAYGSATVRAYGSATVRAYDSATVGAYDSATVEAYGSATVEAYGSATVEAYGSATVSTTQWGQPTISVAGYAVWIDRKNGVPVIHAVTGAQFREAATPTPES